jgi:hypothetical protein
MEGVGGHMLMAGAGPVGMTMALRRRGVVDRDDTRPILEALRRAAA